MSNRKNHTFAQRQYRHFRNCKTAADAIAKGARFYSCRPNGRINFADPVILWRPEKVEIRLRSPNTLPTIAGASGGIAMHWTYRKGPKAGFTRALAPGEK